MRAFAGRTAGLLGLLAGATAAAYGLAPAHAALTHAAAATAGPGASEISRVERAIARLHLPGGVLAVTGSTPGSFERAFGLAAPGRPMSLGDHFRIGSITKTFTATVILELVDQHRLSLNDVLSRWEPRVPDAAHITIAMLLDMRSGIWDEGGTGPDGKPSLLSQWVTKHCAGHDAACGSRVWTPQQIVNLAIQQGQAYPPGVWYYSDTNYAVLAIIAQDVTHQPLARLLTRMVLNPLHLTQTSFPVASTAMPRPATAGYVPKAGGGYQLADQVNPSLTYGAGNMISTVHDLQLWAADLARGALLTPQTQRLRLRLWPTDIAVPPLAGTGVTTTLIVRYGLGVADLSNLIGHNGFVTAAGYSAEMWALPGGRGSVVELFNSIGVCSGEYLADLINSSLAQSAFGPALYRVAGPVFTCR